MLTLPFLVSYGFKGIILSFLLVFSVYILTIIESRCIGCGACGVACQDDAIGYAHKEIEIESVLKQCIDAGIENIELHASVIDDKPVLHEWEIVNKII